MVQGRDAQTREQRTKTKDGCALRRLICQIAADDRLASSDVVGRTCATDDVGDQCVGQLPAVKGVVHDEVDQGSLGALDVDAALIDERPRMTVKPRLEDVVADHLQVSWSRDEPRPLVGVEQLDQGPQIRVQRSIIIERDYEIVAASPCDAESLKEAHGAVLPTVTTMNGGADPRWSQRARQQSIVRTAIDPDGHYTAARCQALIARDASSAPRTRGIEID